MCVTMRVMPRRFSGGPRRLLAFAVRAVVASAVAGGAFGACKSAPPPAVVTPAPPVIPRDTKLAWILRLEQQRTLRDAGLPAVSFTAGAARALRADGVAALDVLSLDLDPGVRRRAVLAVGRIGALEGVPALVSALQDPVEDVRATAAFGLGLLGASAKDAVKPLETLLLNDTSAVVRARAIEIGRAHV